MEDRCIACGIIIPEGRQVCPTCEEGTPRINIGKKINLDKAKKIAEIEGCVTKKSYFTGLLYATDYSDVLIASDHGAVRIPVELMLQVLKEAEMFAVTTAKSVKALTTAEKNAIARNKGISYGKFKAILDVILQIKESEQE